MRICIPTVEDRGLESRLSGHFGRAPFFTLLDTDSGEVETRANDNAAHLPGQPHPWEPLVGWGLSAVATRHVGRGGYLGLTGAGIAVLRTTARTVAEVVEAHRAGELTPMALEETHQHGHGHHGGGPGHS